MTQELPTATVRPMLENPTTLLKKAWQLMLANAGVLFTLSLAPLVFAFFVGLLAAGSKPATVIGGIIAGIVHVLTAIAVIAVLNARSTGETKTISQAYKVALERFLPLVLTGLLIGLASFGGMLIFLLPGILIVIWASFATYIVVLEEISGLKAFVRSAAYVKDYWAAIFGRNLFVGFLAMLPMIAFFIVKLIVIGAQTKTPGMDAVFNSLYSFAITPLLACYSYLLYRNIIQIKGTEPVAPAKARGVVITFAIIGIVLVIAFVGLAVSGLGTQPAMPLQ